MIGQIDRHGRIGFPASFEAPARRTHRHGSTPTLLVWGLAILLVLSLTATVTISLRDAVVHPQIPVQELNLGPGLGLSR